MLDQAYYAMDTVCGTIQLIVLLCLSFIRFVSMVQTTLLFENAAVKPVLHGKLNKEFRSSKNGEKRDGCARSNDRSEIDCETDSPKASSSGQ